MVEEKKQVDGKSYPTRSRFTADEINLIKNTFFENEALLKIIRKKFLQLPLHQFEKIAGASLLSKDVLKIVRKMILPEMDGDAPITQITDHWQFYRESSQPNFIQYSDKYIEARRIMINYLEGQMSWIEGKGEGKMNFKDLTIFDDFENLYARQMIVDNVELGLNQLLLMASIKEETPEEMNKRLTQNSNK